MQKSFIVENVEVDLSNLTEKVKEEIDPIAKVELNPKFEGRQMIMVLAPR